MGRHAVIGARGQIGQLLVDELVARGHEVVAVAHGWAAPDRRPGVECRGADAADPAVLSAALAGCEVAHAVLGLPYRSAVWEAQWPPLMGGVLDAAERAGCRLVYLDNLYAYGQVDGPITEDTPLRPVSRMDRARAATSEILLAAASRGAPVTIGRAGDFLGPGASSSSAGERFFAGVLARDTPVRRVRWLGRPDARHCWAGTPTVAAALATLGETPDPGPLWLLPVHGPITGRELCNTLGRVAGCRVVPRATPTWAVRLAGLADPEARAAAGQMYQLTGDQVLDDRRWRARFPVGGPTLEGLLADTLAWFAGRPADAAAAGHGGGR